MAAGVVVAPKGNVSLGLDGRNGTECFVVCSLGTEGGLKVEIGGRGTNETTLV